MGFLSFPKKKGPQTREIAHGPKKKPGAEFRPGAHTPGE
jgi:hypothetical protein